MPPRPPVALLQSSSDVPKTLISISVSPAFIARASAAGWENTRPSVRTEAPGTPAWRAR